MHEDAEDFDAEAADEVLSSKHGTQSLSSASDASIGFCEQIGSTHRMENLTWSAHLGYKPPMQDFKQDAQIGCRPRVQNWTAGAIANRVQSLVVQPMPGLHHQFILLVSGFSKHIKKGDILKRCKKNKTPDVV